VVELLPPVAQLELGFSTMDGRGVQAALDLALCLRQQLHQDSAIVSQSVWSLHVLEFCLERFG
jgi:hypothetical protein